MLTPAAAAAAASSPAPSRSIRLDGASNFRDLGGYTGLDGRRVRWRTLFRADHLAGLSAADLDVLQGLKLARSADFRGKMESAHLAYEWPGIARHALIVEPTVVQRASALIAAGNDLTAAHAEELMQDTYRSFVHDYAPRFAQLFQLLLDSQDPLVFHCTAGKDRTGWAAALLLTALGVDEDTVMQDYLLTNQLYQRPAATFAPMPAEVMDVLWRVQASYLAAATDMVRADFGGMQGYLRDALGIDSAARERLAALYLEG
ncbi:tyrosine-protein phosphatase [Delftia acidovorans]|uniref:Tyrosine-protein phosphatase n=1 Tax=Delftia acidovorans TaxID=80866 RepID=A0AAJ2V6N3_DELAC|nr:tyrosine-protein phosphatase [Delftia acidovorans]MDX4951974.1 tyrosine-protein phosphatase [Delftia acidovorans]